MTRRRVPIALALVFATGAAIALHRPTSQEAVGEAMPEPSTELVRASVREAPNVSAAFGSERGLPAFVERYAPDEYGGHRQSWDVVQAPSGLVYVANSDGVLEYDGATWRLIEVPNFRARALAVGPDGTVYVGGEGTAGILAPDSSGALGYHEILDVGALDGEPVWAAVPLDDEGVVFQTFRRLLTVTGRDVVDVEDAPDGQRFHKAFEAAGRVYVRLEGVGLLHYDGDLLRLSPGGDQFANVPVRALFDLDGQAGGSLLLVTDAELFRFDPTGQRPTAAVQTDATDILTATRAYHGCAVGPKTGPGRYLALTTLGAGVLIMDGAGMVVEHLGRSVGLSPSDLVLGCGTDAQGGLWLALSEGILRLDVASPLSVFDGRLGLTGTIYGMSRHFDDLYVSTERGVFRIVSESADRAVSVEPVVPDEGEIDQAWRSYTTEEGMIVAATGGIFEIDGTSARLLADESAFSLSPIGADPGAPERMLVGLRDGIAILEPEADSWFVRGRVEGVTAEVRSFAEVPRREGAWAVDADGRLYRIDSTGRLVRSFGLEEGVPDGLASIWLANGETLAMTSDGPYRIHLDEATGALDVEPADDLTRLAQLVTDDLAEGYGISTDETGRLWVTGRDRVRAFAREDGAWVDVTPDALRQMHGVWSVLAEDGVLWVGTTDGLFRLAEGSDGRYAMAVPALLRSVTADGEGVAVHNKAVTAPYGAAVRFRFSAAAFNDPAGTSYRTELVGFDGGPSEWSDERFRDYTNLPPGDYAFRIEARTAQGALAQPATVAVTIPPPWYLTGWAAVLWAVLAGLVLALVAWAAGTTHRRTARAERARADELESLNEALRLADKLKDDMLANTSHELRTPLVAVLGFAELLAEYDGDDPAEVREYARHMLSGGNRLLRTANDILDVARLRAGRVELEPRPVDAVAVVRDVVAELAPIAAERGVALLVTPSTVVLPSVLDAEAVGRIVTNLVSNAVKFTDEGSVRVTVAGDAEALRITVADTGRGIDPSFLPFLFEEYQQESTGYGRVAEGSGLGLAITKRLVDLMGGTVEVESEVGVGTTFHVRLPRGLAPVVSGDGQSAEAAPAFQPPADAR